MIKDPAHLSNHLHTGQYNARTKQIEKETVQNQKSLNNVIMFKPLNLFNPFNNSVSIIWMRQFVCKKIIPISYNLLFQRSPSLDPADFYLILGLLPLVEKVAS